MTVHAETALTCIDDPGRALWTGLPSYALDDGLTECMSTVGCASPYESTCEVTVCNAVKDSGDTVSLTSL